MIRIFLTIILVTFISKGISAQDAPSFDEFVKENSWYVSNVPTEKLSDPKNKIGEIGFEPFSFEMIPFEIDDQKFNEMSELAQTNAKSSFLHRSKKVKKQS